jgi:hypothetical protein
MHLISIRAIQTQDEYFAYGKQGPELQHTTKNQSGSTRNVRITKTDGLLTF